MFLVLGAMKPSMSLSWWIFNALRYLFLSFRSP